MAKRELTRVVDEQVLSLIRGGAHMAKDIERGLQHCEAAHTLVSTRSAACLMRVADVALQRLKKRGVIVWLGARAGGWQLVHLLGA